MSTEHTSGEQQGASRGGNRVMGGGYGLGFIGAVVYFVQHAHTFGEGLLGVLKAIVWPAVLVYGLLEHMAR